ncbi:hypothetical protein AB0368_28405 [Actinoplanes sp. NPDC051475]|uniref:hypothetical protein n=1 Tax=Actinoplanes sp. NPDC051475 TaxID=3157225 RepID=UPI003450ACDB
MDVTFAGDGSATIVPTSEEAAALGEEFGELLTWFATTLTALSYLRTGDTDEFDRKTWAHMLATAERHLGGRLDGIRDALIRAHATVGGTYGEVAKAMAVARSTAQYRRDRVTASAPSEWERWAVSGARSGGA